MKFHNRLAPPFFNLLFFFCFLNHRMAQPHPTPSFSFRGSNAARMATLNISASPSCVSAEHSQYANAPTSLANAWPLSVDTAESANSFSPRRSILVPTKITGTFANASAISGIHFKDTFFIDEGEIVEKQTRNTSVCG